VSSLQCPATMLVVPVAGVEALQLGRRRVAQVWCDRASAGPAEAAAARLGVGVTQREDIADRATLGEIADVHPGETVLVVSSKVLIATEVVADTDGWSRRPLGEAGADDRAQS
jgi:hypothetical protein